VVKESKGTYASFMNSWEVAMGASYDNRKILVTSGEYEK